VWSAHAADNPSVDDRSAEHGVAADRCAREIIRFLTVCVARLRRLNGTPFGGAHQRSVRSFSVLMYSVFP
jgi:hypothetical protein